MGAHRKAADPIKCPGEGALRIGRGRKSTNSLGETETCKSKGGGGVP